MNVDRMNRLQGKASLGLGNHPSQELTTKDVNVQVRDFLPAVCTDIGEKAISGLDKPLGPRHRSHRAHKSANFRVRCFGAEIVPADIFALGDHQSVDLSLRIDVLKGEGPFVLIDFVRGDLPAQDLREGMMILTRCVNAGSARRSVDWQVLIVIAASIGIGAALAKTGAASAIAEQLVGFASGNPLLALALIYLMTVLCTELITNNAAAVLMFPIALVTAQQMDVSIMPFVIAIMFAASCSFSTPIGYQTNLMVYGPGGYRFTDYLRFGLPITVILGIMALVIIPMVWGF